MAHGCDGCSFWDGDRCGDPISWVDSNGEETCRYHDDARTRDAYESGDTEMTHAAKWT